MSNEMSNRQLISLFVGVGLLGLTTSRTISSFTANKIPQTDKVQQGYVIPSKLEIELQDLDGNGQKEVLMNYDGNTYLLTLDEQGRPRVQAYEVKPTEVLKKE